jgi:hypothetical protein
VLLGSFVERRSLALLAAIAENSLVVTMQDRTATQLDSCNEGVEIHDVERSLIIERGIFAYLTGKIEVDMQILKIQSMKDL